jgi:bifunctional non-homologous end joining protein LigD
MAAKLVERLPEGDQWLYEVKWDGYRALLLKEGARFGFGPGTTRT